MTDTTDRTKWWRRFRFRSSLRLLMVVVLIIGGLLGWVGYRARVQREIVAAVERAGAQAFYDFQAPGARPAWWQPKWLVDAVGVDYFARVTQVHDVQIALGMGQFKGLTDADLALIGRLGHLETLMLFSSPTISEVGLSHLRGLTRLKYLHIRNLPRVSGASLAHIAGLTELEHLHFDTPRIVDADLAQLSGLVRLSSLVLMLDETSDLTDAGLVHLEPLTGLRSLQLDRATKITNAGLAHLGKLTK